MKLKLALYLAAAILIALVVSGIIDGNDGLLFTGDVR
jgi:hypothetical protein